MGSVIVYNDNSVEFAVSSLEGLKIIIDHFNKYFFNYKKKQVDFELFKKAFYLIQNKEHLTENGLCKIISFRASINLGLSDELTSAFPNITPMERSLVLSPKIVNPK